jgi:hypothetical protein
MVLEDPFVWPPNKGLPSMGLPKNPSSQLTRKYLILKRVRFADIAARNQMLLGVFRLGL